MLTYDKEMDSILIEDWSKFDNNTYHQVQYNVRIETTDEEGQELNVTFQGNFNMIVGEVELVFTKMSDTTLKYNEDLIIDYSDVYDPYLPRSAEFEFTWLLNGQSVEDFESVVSLTALERLQKLDMFFDKDYEFQVIINNINSDMHTSIAHEKFFVRISSPQEESVTECSDLNIQFEDSLQIYQKSDFQTQIVFDNQNYTDVIIQEPHTSLSECSSSIRDQNIVGLTLLVDGTDEQVAYFEIDDDILFDSDDLKHEIQLQNQAGNEQLSYKIYAFLVNNDTQEITGYTYHKLIFKENPQTLFAGIRTKDIQVDQDKILYLDGSDSYDERELNFYNFEFIWTIKGNNGDIELGTTKYRTFDLSPQDRQDIGANQPGLFYTYYLQVKDETRISDKQAVTVKISPQESQRQNCKIKISRENEEEQEYGQGGIILYRNQDKELKASNRGNCDNVQGLGIVWESQSIQNWQFWNQTEDDSYTIMIDKENVNQLPLQKPIKMSVTFHFRQQDGIEYITKDEFTLIVLDDSLMIANDFDVIYEGDVDDIVFDASASYDQIEMSNNVDCLWTCPESFSDLCSTRQGCVFEIANDDLIQASSYNTSIVNKVHLFSLTISKDERQSTQKFFITVTESSDYPMCAVAPKMFNQYFQFEALCDNIDVNTTYKWEIMDAEGSENLAPQSVNVNQETFRIHPVMFFQSEEVVIKLTVTNGLGLQSQSASYIQINDQQYFEEGSIQQSKQSVRSYIDEVELTPENWNAEYSFGLFYQLRIKENQDSHRVLLSPTFASSDKPLKISLPPMPYENILYVDIFDVNDQHITETFELESSVSTQVTPQYFALTIADIIFTPLYEFDESEFEQIIYKLQNVFRAYAYNDIDAKGFPRSFFKTLSEATIEYIYNYIYIDGRLGDIRSDIRQAIIKQHLIDIFYFITLKHRDTKYNSDILDMLEILLSDDKYTHGTTFVTTSGRALSIIYQTMDTVQDKKQDRLIKKLFRYFNKYSLEGEDLQIPQINNQGIGYKLQKVKKAKDVKLVDDINIDPQVLQAAIIENGYVMSGRNSTFMSIQIMDENMEPQIYTDLENDVNVTFRLTDEEIFKIQNENATFFCSSRELMGEDWQEYDDDEEEGFDIEKKTVTCSFDHLSQYTLFLQGTEEEEQGNADFDPLNPPTNYEIEEPDGDDQKPEQPIVVEVEGNPLIRESNTLFFTLTSILVLVGFILTTLIFFLIYRNDKDDDTDQSVTIQSSQTLWQKRRSLFSIIFKQFNPYFNLFTVRYRFLARWIRNLIIQIYFLLVSTFFLVMFISSQRRENMLNGGLVFLYILFTTLLVLTLRPLCIRLLSKLFYDSNNKIQQLDSFIEDDSKEDQVRKSGQVPNGDSQNEINQNNANKNKEEQTPANGNINNNAVNAKETARGSRNLSKVQNTPEHKGPATRIGDDTLVLDDVEEQVNIANENSDGKNKNENSTTKLHNQADFKVKEVKYDSNTRGAENSPSKNGSNAKQNNKKQGDQSSRTEGGHGAKELDQLTDVDDKESVQDLDPNSLSKKRLMGIIMVITVWCLLMLLHILVLREMRKTQFKYWAIVSSLVFVGIQLVIDPILYFWLAISMISKDKENQIEYYLSNNKTRKMTQLFVRMFVGKYKMRELGKKIQVA